MPNSSVCGAIRSVLATATRIPKTIRPTRPAGTVLGSVIMKNRKIISSGDVTMTRKAYDYSGGAFQFQTAARSAYDSYGRQVDAYNGNGNKTHTGYTVNSVGLTTGNSSRPDHLRIQQSVQLPSP